MESAKRFYMIVIYASVILVIYTFVPFTKKILPPQSVNFVTMDEKGVHSEIFEGQGPSPEMSTDLPTVKKPSLDFNKLFWEQRLSRNSSPEARLQLQEAILAEVNLWRPVDEFGNANRSYDDRILAQIVWAKNLQPTAVKRIALPDGLRNWYMDRKSFDEKMGMECPNLVNHCEYMETNFTPSADQLRGLDAVIFNYKTSYQHFPAVNYTRAVYILESRGRYHHATLKGNDLLISYWTGSDIVDPYGKWVYYDDSIQSKIQEKNYAARKTRMAAIFMSNCNPAQVNNTRLELVLEMQKLGLSVDIYGACGTLKCSRRIESTCFGMLKRNYKFYLAFENSCCREYITEKFFWNALNNDVVPVVYGAPLEDYLLVAPRNSFIYVDSFPKRKELVEYLQFLDRNDAYYNQYFQWKGTGELLNVYFIFCRFCAMLHYADIVPIPVRTQSLEWNAADNAKRPGSTSPCYPYNTSKLKKRKNRNVVGKLHDNLNKVKGKVHDNLNKVKGKVHGNLNKVKGKVHGNLNKVNGKVHGNLNRVKGKVHGNLNKVKDKLNGNFVNKVKDKLNGNFVNKVKDKLNGNFVSKVKAKLNGNFVNKVHGNLNKGKVKPTAKVKH